MLFGAGVFTSLYENNPLIIVIISVFLGILGLCFFATKNLIIDKEEAVIHDEMRLLGMKFKSDIKLDNYCYITILKQLYSQTSSNRYMPDTQVILVNMMLSC